MFLKRFAGLFELFKQRESTQGQGYVHATCHTIDLGLELPALKHSGDVCRDVGRYAELSDVTVICFLEGVDPTSLPVSDSEALRIQGELASLKKRDPLEVYAYCCEWLLAEGSFQRFSQRGGFSPEHSDEGKPYAP